MQPSKSNVLHIIFDSEKTDLLIRFREKYFRYGIKKRVQELIEEDLKTGDIIN